MKVILDLEPGDYIDGADLARSFLNYLCANPDTLLVGYQRGEKWFSVKRNKHSITVRRSS